jgi:RNA-directed DNA polymerase
MKRVRERIHELTDSRRSGRDLSVIIKSLNPVLRGWGNYFPTGNADAKFDQVDGYVYDRLLHWLYCRSGQRWLVRPAAWPQERFLDMGLYRLQGTACYPVHATQ